MKNTCTVTPSLCTNKENMNNRDLWQFAKITVSPSGLILFDVLLMNLTCLFFITPSLPSRKPLISIWKSEAEAFKSVTRIIFQMCFFKKQLVPQNVNFVSQ